MNKTYAILDEKGGWLVNLVVWSGDTSDWQPPIGTIAVPVEQVDIQALPQKPDDVS